MDQYFFNAPRDADKDCRPYAVEEGDYEVCYEPFEHRLSHARLDQLHFEDLGFRFGGIPRVHFWIAPRVRLLTRVRDIGTEAWRMSGNVQVASNYLGMDPHGAGRILLSTINQMKGSVDDFFKQSKNAFDSRIVLRDGARVAEQTNEEAARPLELVILEYDQDRIYCGGVFYCGEDSDKQARNHVERLRSLPTVKNRSDGHGIVIFDKNGETFERKISKISANEFMAHARCILEP
jgi:hypothetical protein